MMAREMAMAMAMAMAMVKRSIPEQGTKKPCSFSHTMVHAHTIYMYDVSMYPI
jgi:hypothetical protein